MAMASEITPTFDDDNDATPDVNDAFPLNAAESP